MCQCTDCIDIASVIFALDGFTIATVPMTDAKCGTNCGAEELTSDGFNATLYPGCYESNKM